VPLFTALTPPLPPLAPTTTAVPEIEAQFDAELQKYVSPPPPPALPPVPLAIAVPPVPAVPTEYVTDVPGVSDTLETLEYPPPPPPLTVQVLQPLAPPPPPPMTSMVLFEESQSLGTVHVVPDVRKITVAAFACRGVLTEKTNSKMSAMNALRRIRFENLI
jgi:hypothetical protein